MEENVHLSEIDLEHNKEKERTNLHKETETNLPLKKRKHSVAANLELEEVKISRDETELIEEIIRRRAEKIENEDISYPAIKAISIAETLRLADSRPRPVKTLAQKKLILEMPCTFIKTSVQKKELDGIIYPPLPAISVSEIQEKIVGSLPCTFIKTPLQKKEILEVSTSRAQVPPRSSH